MIKADPPHGALLFLVLGIFAYWALAIVVPGPVLLGVFNPLMLAIAVVVSWTWVKTVWRVLRSDRERDGEWPILVGITLLWILLVYQRIYTIVMGHYGRPDWVYETAIPGFLPYSLFLVGALFLYAPAAQESRLVRTSVLQVAVACVAGGLVAGVLIGLNIPTE